MMLPVIVTPSVEMWATAWLRTALTGRSEAYASGVVVSNKIGSPRPARLVAVRDDGGPRTNLLQTGLLLGVNVMTPIETDCMNLAALVEGLLLSVVNVPPVDQITSVSSPAWVNDPAPFRKYFTVRVLMRGAVA